MKHLSDEEMICYCFHYTAGDIRRDVTKPGESTIVQHILHATQTGTCDCVNTHPNGT